MLGFQLRCGAAPLDQDPFEGTISRAQVITGHMTELRITTGVWVFVQDDDLLDNVVLERLCFRADHL
jgi:hypothetical protein